MSVDRHAGILPSRARPSRKRRYPPVSVGIMGSFVKKECGFIELIPFTEWAFIKPPADEVRQSFCEHLSVTTAPGEMGAVEYDMESVESECGEVDEECTSTGSTSSPLEETIEMIWEEEAGDGRVWDSPPGGSVTGSPGAATGEVTGTPDNPGERAGNDLIHFRVGPPHNNVESVEQNSPCHVHTGVEGPHVRGDDTRGSNPGQCALRPAAAADRIRMSETGAGFYRDEEESTEDLPPERLVTVKSCSIDCPRNARKIVYLCARLVPNVHGRIGGGTRPPELNNNNSHSKVSRDAGDNRAKLGCRGDKHHATHADIGCQAVQDSVEIKSQLAPSIGGGYFDTPVAERKLITDTIADDRTTQKPRFLLPDRFRLTVNKTGKAQQPKHSNNIDVHVSADCGSTAIPPPMLNNIERSDTSSERSCPPVHDSDDKYDTTAVNPLRKSRTLADMIGESNDFNRAGEAEPGQDGWGPQVDKYVRRANCEPGIMTCSKPRIPVVILEEEEEDGSAGAGAPPPPPHRLSIPSPVSPSRTICVSPTESLSSSRSVTSSLGSSGSPPRARREAMSSSVSPTSPRLSPNSRIPVVIIEDDEDVCEEEGSSSPRPAAGAAARVMSGISKPSASWPLMGLAMPTPEQTERLQMIADGAIRGSPHLERRRGSNVSTLSNENEDDLDELKILAARLNLQTRRPSYCVWKDKYINSRQLKVARTVPEFAEEHEEIEEADEGVQVEDEGDAEGEERDDWSLERKMRIDSALDWLQRELKAMREQDKELARQLMKIRQTIHEVKLQRCTEENREKLAEAIEIEEERNEFAELFDFVPDQFSPSLKSAGVTRMNINRRRFSVF